MLRLLISMSLAGYGAPFPFIASLPDVTNKHLLTRQQSGGGQPGGPLTCPFNPNHEWPTPSNSKFPYNGAINGIPGRGVGGYQVPSPGDDAHKFIAPRSTDIRGPCPGLNAAANHGFLARDGITNYTELVDGVQNGYDLANFLAVFSVIIADGDIATKKLSIGCDATTRTSISPLLTGSEPGLDGHNKFEADASLTRNDYFLAGGDNYNFNGTLFGMMTQTTGGVFDLKGFTEYRYQRYQQSRVENSQFFFGPLGLFQYGAASFVYELMPNGNDEYTPNLQNTASFFGAKQQSDGTWTHVPEQIPANWTNRVQPYTLLDVTAQIAAQYGAHPVGIGGNANGNFIGLDFPPYINKGSLTTLSPSGLACLLYQFISVPIPSSFNGFVTPTVEALEFVLTAIGGAAFKNLGCPLPVT
ncbi:Cloroperoxidase [Myriangium duriaei CBS 260.36]|uniref:Cloroperoxidase n=1 Tax=Myriangium duriaei CBS 260.36 TaxID=1168546 RepID=A0A9P4MJ12_9PEZI|nr:Cloroperoxidase [Myriangium duriaei CBS 260.36]